MLINRENTVSNLEYRRDLNTDPTILNMTKEDVDFAIWLEYMEGSLYPDIVNNLDLYAYLTLT
jgi:hypothetical protein